MTFCLPGMNISGAQGGHFGSYKQFTNLITVAYPLWSDLSGFTNPYMALDGWLYNIPSPPTNSTVNLIVQVDDIAGYTTYTYLRSGIYKLAWNGNATATVTGSNVANDAAAQTAQLTIPTGYTKCYAVTLTGNNTTLNLAITNSSGSAVNFAPVGGRSPILYHVNDEADVNAGKPFQRDFLKSYEGIGIIRHMDSTRATEFGYDAAGLNLLGTTGIGEFSQLPTEASRCWANIVTLGPTPAAAIPCSWPPSLIGKLAAATNADIFYCVPSKMSAASQAPIAAAITAQLTGQSVVLEPGDEFWNTGYPWAGAAKNFAIYWAENINVVDSSGTPITPLYFTLNTTNNTFDFGTMNIAARFTDGDTINVTWNDNQRPVSAWPADGSNEYGKHYWVRKFNNFQVRVFPSSADAIANTNVMTVNGPARTYKSYPNASANPVNGNFIHMVCCGAAECMLAMRAAFVTAGLPASRVSICMSGQAASPSTNATVFAYVDPRTGVQMKNIMKYWATAPYHNPVVGGTITDVSWTWMMENIASLTDAWFDEADQNGYTTVSSPYVTGHASMLASTAPSVLLTSYEGGFPFEPGRAGRYTFATRSGNMLVSSTVMSSKFTSGDRAFIYGTSPYSVADNTFAGQRPYIRFAASDATNKSIYLYASLGLWTADSTNAGTGATVLAGTGPFTLDNETKFLAVTDRIKVYAQGTAALNQFTLAWHSIYKNRQAFYMYFYDCGNDSLLAALSADFLHLSPSHKWMQTTNSSAGRYASKVLLGTR